MSQQSSQVPAIIVDPLRVKERPPTQSAEKIWHHELVGARLIEAAATIRRMPMSTRPKSFGSAWPRFQPMTASELQATENELMQSGGQGALDAWRREQNRVRPLPSGKEIERAEQALSWIPKYLGHDRETAQIVGFWAERTYDVEDVIPVPARAGLKEISRGLRRDRVPVRS